VSGIDGLALLAAVGIVVIWVGYPIAMAALARLRVTQPAMVGGEAPTVTIIIATREAGDALTARVHNCLASCYDIEKLDVVVGLDRGAEDASPATALAGNWDGRLRVVEGDAPGGKAATLNAAVRAARGDVLVFADVHQRFESGTVAALVRPLAAAAVGAVSGSLRLGAPERSRRSAMDYYWRYERWVRRAEARVHSSVGVTGAVYAVRRTLWRPLPPGLILDDVLVPMRIVLGGSRVVWAEDARAEDLRSPSAGHEYRRKVRTLTGVFQLCAWFPALLHPLRNPVWVQFVFHKLLRLLTPYLLLIILAWSLLMAWLALSPAGPATTTSVLVGAIVGLFLFARWRSPRRGFLAQTFHLQTAVVVATFNGLRGRWDVWR
jgi:cellulose synthase/poly-beta-1,6-N-acetylglucosamine synthase-like glycosyltransferase